MIAFIFFILFGLAIGSFLNVCIARLPLGKSTVRPRSHCRSCNRLIANRDNVPVLSWLLLRGACRMCGARIAWQYPLVELATGLLFALCYWVFSPAWVAAAWCFFCSLLLGLAVMDAETLLLPDAFTLTGLGAGLLFAGLRAGFSHASWSWHRVGEAMATSALAAALAAATLLLISGGYWLARRRIGMGFGDVKLLAMLAAWLGVRQTALALFLAVIAGAVYGLTLLFWARGKSETAAQAPLPLGQIPVPFGTVLCLAGLYCVFRGGQTLDWYFQFFH